MGGHRDGGGVGSASVALQMTTYTPSGPAAKIVFGGGVPGGYTGYTVSIPPEVSPPGGGGELRYRFFLLMIHARLV